MSARDRQSTTLTRSPTLRPISKETASTKCLGQSNGGRIRNISSTGYNTNTTPTPSKTPSSKRNRTPSEASTTNALLPPSSGTNKNKDTTPVSGNKSRDTTPVSGNTSRDTTPVSGNTRRNMTPVSGNKSRDTTPVSGNTRRGSTPVSVNTSRDTTPVSGNTRRDMTPVSGNTRRGPTPVSGKTRRDTTPVSGNMSRDTTPVSDKTGRGSTPVSGNTSRDMTPVSGNTSRGSTPVLCNTSRDTTLVSASTKRGLTPVSDAAETSDQRAQYVRVIAARAACTKTLLTIPNSNKGLVLPNASTMEKLEERASSINRIAVPEPTLNVTPAPPPPAVEPYTTALQSQSKDESIDLSREMSRGKGYTAMFTPQPYTFKLKDKEVGPDEVTEQLPPYWMLMDHMLAVIWCLNSPKHKNIPLSISQLQWALYILTAIRTKRGDHTKDVSALIDMIQDRLLDSYASIARTGNAQESGHRIKSINTTKKHVASKEESTKKSKTQLRPPIKEESRCCPQSSVLSSFEDVEELMRNKKPRGLATSPYGQTSTARSRPASIGYDEIMLRSPPFIQGVCPTAIRSRVVCRRKFVFENVDTSEVDYRPTHQTTTWSQVPSNVIPNRPHTPVRFAEPLETGNVSIEEMMSFMQQWRAGQVQRIKSEMTHLRSIEEFMAKVDPSKFEPYVEGKLAKRLKEIERKMSPSNYIRSLDTYTSY